MILERLSFLTTKNGASIKIASFIDDLKETVDTLKLMMLVRFLFPTPSQQKQRVLTISLNYAKYQKLFVADDKRKNRVQTSQITPKLYFPKKR